MKSLLITFSSVISFLTILLMPTVPGYELMVVFPLSFLLCYFIFISPIIKRYKSIITYIFVIYSELRYVVTPFLISIAGSSSSSYFLTNNIDSIRKATLLMLYELIILSVFLYYTMSIKGNKFQKLTIHPANLKGRRFIYLSLGLIAIGLLIVTPEIRENLSFLIIRTEVGTRVNEDLNSINTLLRQIVLTAIVMVFLTVISITKDKFNKTGKKKYFHYAVIFAFVNISIIVGERRIMQVYTAFATAYVLITVYPQYKKETIKTILSLTLIVVGLMSAYKFLNVFMFESYTEAFTSSNLDLHNYSTIFQSYFYGPQNVAISVDLAQIGFQPFSRLIYDIVRSTMGINFLVKDLMWTTSDVFNTYIYGTYMPSGHPISSVGYGYLYLGGLLSPLFSLLFFNTAINLEYLMRKTQSLEMKYIYSYLLLRIAEPFSAMPAKINIATLVLFSWGTIYVISYIIRLLTSKNNIKLTNN